MVGHDTPREQAIPFTVSEQKCILDDASAGVVSQDTAADALVQEGLYMLAFLGILFFGGRVLRSRCIRATAARGRESARWKVMCWVVSGWSKWGR